MKEHVQKKQNIARGWRYGDDMEGVAPSRRSARVASTTLSSVPTIVEVAPRGVNVSVFSQRKIRLDLLKCVVSYRLEGS